MKSDKIVEQINNYTETTIYSLFKSITKLKITTLVTLLTIIFSLFSGVFMIGRYSNEKEIAIELKKPFDMKIEGGLEYKDLALVPNDKLIERGEDFNVYTIKEIKDEFSDKPIGYVVIKKDADDTYKGPFSWLFGK